MGAYNSSKEHLSYWIHRNPMAQWNFLVKRAVLLETTSPTSRNFLEHLCFLLGCHLSIGRGLTVEQRRQNFGSITLCLPSAPLKVWLYCAAPVVNLIYFSGQGYIRKSPYFFLLCCTLDNCGHFITIEHVLQKQCMKYNNVC